MDIAHWSVQRMSDVHFTVQLMYAINKLISAASDGAFLALVHSAQCSVRVALSVALSVVWRLFM